MQIQLDDELVRQLEEIARSEQRGVTELMVEIVEEYFRRRSEMETFKAEVREVMKKHSDLLEKLAKN